MNDLATAEARVDSAASSWSVQQVRNFSTPSPGGDALPSWPALHPIETYSATSAEPFPFHGIGAVLGPAAAAIARDVQAPAAMAAGAVLAAASLAAQPHYDIRMPHGQVAPLSVFVVTSARSGDRKSAVDEIACAAISEVRREQARKYLQAQEQADPDDPAPKPRALITSNATVEGLARLLKSQSSVGIFSPDAGEVVAGHSMREDRRAAALSFLLKAWSGETLDMMRAGDGLSVLLGRRVAMHIMVQPVLLTSLLADPLAREQGLLARCLLSQPATLAGTRKFRHVDATQDPAVIEFNRRIRALLETPPVTWSNSDDHELRPATLPLSGEATAAWIEFYNQVEEQQGPGGELEHAYAFASKAAEHAARLAGIVTAIDGQEFVTGTAMLGAIEVVTYYLNEHLRLTQTGRDQQRREQLLTLVEYLQRHGGKWLPLSEILQRCPRAVRNLKKAGVVPLLEELQTRGYVRRVEPNSWEVRNVQA